MTRSLVVCVMLAASACSAHDPAESVEASEPQALVAPPARGCAVILCKPGYVCKEGCDGPRCVPLPPSDPECRVDADCRLFSDYCEGCNCVALGAKEPNPICKGDLVQCFVDPCLNLQARCEYGSCVASSGAAVE
jgi:hypothetical protein